MKRCLAYVLFAVFASVTHAATWDISGGGNNKLSDAITSATAGDTINITDSQIYIENQINIDKRIFITATAGQTPTIKNAGIIPNTPPGNVSTVLGPLRSFIAFTADSGSTWSTECAKLGSLSGGRITIEYQTQTTATVTTSIFNFLHGDNLYAALENLDIVETGGNVPIQVIQHASTVSGRRNEYINLSYVDINMNVTNNLSLAHNQAPAIMAGLNLTNYVSGNHETYNLDHVRIKNFGSAGISVNNIQALLNMSYCDIGTLGATSNDPLYPSACLQNRNAYTPATFNIDRCIFRAPAVGCAVQLGGGGTSSAWTNRVYGTIPNTTSATLTRSVLLAKYPANAAGYATPAIGVGYGPLIVSYCNGGTWTAGRPQDISLDHCDIVDLTTGTITNVACIVRPSSQRTNAATNLTVTNSNVYSVNNAALLQLANATTFPFVFSDHHNNWYGAVPNTTGLINGEGDVSMDPMYQDAESGDMRYNNNTLKRADQNMQPVGVNAGYQDVVAGIIPGTDSILNRAHGWTVLN